jgi:hypothetical protein
MQQLCTVVYAFFQDKKTNSVSGHQINSVDRRPCIISWW